MRAPVRFSIYLTRGNGGLQLMEAARSRGSKASIFLREMAQLGCAISELGYFLGPDGEPMRRLPSGQVEVLRPVEVPLARAGSSRPEDAGQDAGTAPRSEPAPRPPSPPPASVQPSAAPEPSPPIEAQDGALATLLSQSADFADWH